MDFGQGFYLTASFEQATRWAKSKAIAYNKREKKNSARGVVVSYRVDKATLAGKRFLSFDDFTEEWALFVLANRTLTKTEIEKDVAFGPLADGIDLGASIYEVQHLGKPIEDFKNEITGSKYAFPTEHQFSFHTKESVKALKYMGVKIV